MIDHSPKRIFGQTLNFIACVKNKQTLNVPSAYFIQKNIMCCSTAVAQNYLQFHFYIEWFWIIEHRNSDLHQLSTRDKMFKNILGLNSISLISKEIPKT